MKRCQKCKIPLEGRIFHLLQKILKMRISTVDPQKCNKCAPGPTTEKYTCQICDRVIDEKNALSHVKAEEYLLSLIKKDHPQWRGQKETCPECIEYYRNLINKAKI